MLRFTLVNIQWGLQLVLSVISRLAQFHCLYNQKTRVDLLLDNENDHCYHNIVNEAQMNVINFKYYDKRIIVTRPSFFSFLSMFFQVVLVYHSCLASSDNITKSIHIITP